MNPGDFLLEIAVGAIGLVQGVAVGAECARIEQPLSCQLQADAHALYQVGVSPYAGVDTIDRLPHPDLDLSRPALAIAQDRKHPVGAGNLSG